MKTLFLGIFILLLSTTSFANDQYHWKKPAYPTEKIGEFMNFCIGAMNMRQMQEGNINQSVVDTHARVCSCIMDSFRTGNDESVFDREFKASRMEGVPNFSKYLRQCGEISNYQNLLQYGT